VTTLDAVIFGATTSARPSFPPAVNPFLGSFLPFDVGNDTDQVHTTLPPEAIPLWVQQVRQIDVWRGDAWGVTTPETPPEVPGCNTTPPNMWMSYLLPFYPFEWQSYYLGEVTKRGYTHLHLDRWNWDQAGLMLPQVVELVQRIQQAGFYVSYWATSTKDDRSGGWAGVQSLIQPVLQSLITGGCAKQLIVVVGGELDNGCVPGPGPTGLDGIINGTCGLTNPVGIPTYLHFTANTPGWPAPGMPIDAWWAQFTGNTPGYGTLKGLLWQGNQTDSAGLQSSHIYDARRYLASAGGQSLHCVAFELIGELQLFGGASETDGRRRGWELCCCTRGPNDTNMPPVYGFGNGGSYPEGQIL
jgi:hypothetical protein